LDAQRLPRELQLTHSDFLGSLVEFFLDLLVLSFFGFMPLKRPLAAAWNGRLVRAKG